MDIALVVDGISFSWDEAKAQANHQKHGVTFEQACEAILDPLIRAEAPEERSGESRITATGMTTSWVLLRVTFTLRGEVVRLVSARRATAQERKTYETS